MQYGNGRGSLRSQFKLARIFKIVAGVLACGASLAAQAAEIYVTRANGFGGGNPGTVGKFDVSGTVVNAALISGLSAPFGIAASDTHLFVSNNNTGDIGQYGFDGSMVNSALISLPGVTGVTVSGTDIFLSSQFDGTIKRYNTAGALINGSVASGLTGPRQTAVAGNILYVASDGGTGTIGAYTTAGVVINAALITGIGQATGVAVSEDGTKLFVASQNPATVSIYSSAGVSLNDSFDTGGSPQYLAVQGDNLYIVKGSGVISQYKTDGTLVNETLIGDLQNPLAIAVVSVPEPGSLALIIVGAGLLCIRRSRIVAR